MARFSMLHLSSDPPALAFLVGGHLDPSKFHAKWKMNIKTSALGESFPSASHLFAKDLLTLLAPHTYRPPSR